MSHIEPIAEMINDVAVAELVLLTDFTNDPASEFVQGFLELELMIEEIVLSDSPEKFFLPDEDGNTPYTLLFEKIQGLKELRFGKKTLTRMERTATGNKKEVPKFTEWEKSQDPSFIRCPKCQIFKKKSGLRKHILNEKCQSIHYAHNTRSGSVKSKETQPSVYTALLDLSGIINRSIDYKKNIVIEPELEVEEEVKVEDEDDDEEIFGCCEGCNINGRFFGKEGDIWYCPYCVGDMEHYPDEEAVIIGTAGSGKTCSKICSKCECEVDRLFVINFAEYCMDCSRKYWEIMDNGDKIIGSCIGCSISYTDGDDFYCRKCLEEMEEADHLEDLEDEEEEEEEMPDLEEVP